METTSDTVDNLAKCSTEHITCQSELQLLVIDLGSSCLIQLEQDPKGISLMLPTLYDAPKEQTILFEMTNPVLVRVPFETIRAAIDAMAGEKGEPRIERSPDGTYYTLFRKETIDHLDQGAFNALSELAGKPLPVWDPKKGEWRQIQAGMGAFQTDLPVAIWRYTKG
jgi:hypothetical protein